MEFWIDIAQAGIRLACPILIAALGETLVQRSGVINIGVEGMMLCGAFAAMLACHGAMEWLGNPILAPYAGVVGGALAGLAISAIFAWFAVARRGDQIVAGAAVNIFALGLTGLLNRRLFGETAAAVTVPTFPDFALPGVSKLPVVGRIFLLSPLALFATALAVAVHIFLYRTRQGLAVRAMGEAPRAADSVGIPVLRARVYAVLFGGIAAGIAGSGLSLLHANTFIEGMSVGKGFIAIAIVIFGRWTPLGVTLGALFFGGIEALGIRLQSGGSTAPYQVYQMAPYALTLLALVGFAGRSRGPTALGQPYFRE